MHSFRICTFSTIGKKPLLCEGEWSALAAQIRNRVPCLFIADLMNVLSHLNKSNAILSCQMTLLHIYKNVNELNKADDFILPMTLVCVPYEQFLDPVRVKAELRNLLENWAVWTPIPSVLTKIIEDYFIGGLFTFSRSFGNWVSIEITNSQLIRWKVTEEPVTKQFIVCDGDLFDLFSVCRKFDPSKKKWCRITQPYGNWTEGNQYANVVLGHQIYCFGSDHDRLNQVYNSRDNSWHLLAPFPKHRKGASAVLISDRTIAIMGGSLDSDGDNSDGDNDGKSWFSLTSSVLLYDVLNNEFTLATWSIPFPLFFFGAHVHDLFLFLTSTFCSRLPYDGVFMSLLDPGSWSSLSLSGGSTT